MTPIKFTQSTQVYKCEHGISYIGNRITENITLKLYLINTVLNIDY